MDSNRKEIRLPAREILNCLPCGLLIINHYGVIIWRNLEAESLLGRNLEGALWEEVLNRLVVPQEAEEEEVFLTNGRRLRLSVTYLKSLPGEVVSITDLTATHAYEQAKANHHRLITIGHMMAQLAHQIRTPLSSAIIYTEHLVSQPSSDRYLHWLTQLQECHASIEQQIRDLLLFAQGEAIELTQVPIKKWIKQLVERAQPLLASQSMQLNIYNNAAIAHIMLHMESFTGAILNLIINALQAKASYINISLQSLNKKGVQIKVEDNGVGMSEEVQSQAFSPFYTTKAQGTGLGLAVVSAVIKAHGGEIILHSLSGQGSCITINLPG